MADILKSKPGARIHPGAPATAEGVVPVLHCHEEIPCNPCASVCPQGLIHVDPTDIRRLPEVLAPAGKTCLGCERCVVVCPGLAITLVDYRDDPAWPIVIVPHEFAKQSVRIGDKVTVLDMVGAVLGEAEVAAIRMIERNDRTVLLKLRTPRAIATRIAGVRVQEPWASGALPEAIERLPDDQIVCRCERITAGEIRDLIRAKYRDMNEIKAVTRAGMGACGGKTCGPLLKRLFREEGVPADEVTDYVPRPLFVEVPLGAFTGTTSGDE